MSDDGLETPSVSVIERKAGGAAAIFTGTLLLVAIVVAAIYLYSRNEYDGMRTHASASAAGKSADNGSKATDGATK